MPASDRPSDKSVDDPTQSRAGEYLLTHAELEHLVAERTADLLRANEALRQEAAERERHQLDLDARQQAEAALRESEQRYRNLFDTIDEGFCVIEVVFDERGRPLDYIFRETNAAFVRHSGFVDAVDKSMRALVPDHDAIWFEAYGRVVTTGEPVRFESEAIAMARWFDVHASRIGGPGSNRVAVLFNDISARKRAEEELRSSEERFQQIAHSVEVVFYVTDLPGKRVLYISPAFERLWGFDAEALYRDQVYWLERIHPDDRPQASAGFERFLSGGESYDAEYRIVLPTGEQRWVRDKATVAARNVLGEVTRITGIAEDITKSKQAADQLRQSEERFRAAIGAVSGLIWTNDAAGRMTGEQPAWSAFTGQTAAEYAGYGWASAVHPDDAQPTIDAWQQAVARRETFIFEHRLRRHDGQWRLCSVRAVPVLSEDGNVREWVGVHTDITEQRQALQAVRESEQRFRNMADNAPVMVWITEADGTCTYLSSSWYKFTGQQPSVALGYGWVSAVHPDDRQLTRDVFASANEAREPFSIEYRLRSASGDYRWFIDAAMPRFNQDGQYLGYVGSVTDISDRKQAEQRVAESRARLQFSLESAQIGDWDLDLVTDQSRRSLRHDQCFGYDQPVERWGLATYLQHIHPDDRAQVERLFYEAVAQQQDWRFESRVIWPDGSVHWVALHGSIYRSAQGEPMHMLGIVSNIDERKRMETQLRQNAADLSEADHRKNEFLAMLAHELRNPLAPIRNALQIVRMSAGNTDLIQNASEVMERQISQMVRLVDDLLDVSRITRDKIELRREQVELSSIIYQAVETSRPAIERARHELVVSLPPEPIYLDADPVRLAQTFSNLLNNSCKYSEPDGHITLRVERQADEAVISLKDTGVGIPAEMLPRIFEMFTQVDRSLERSQGGLGIVLTLVRRLVELHGGKVQAFSDGPGRGSEFVVRLPIISAAAAPLTAKATASDVARPSARRILVVDDNVDSATSLAMLLRLSGNQTHVVHDGQAAVEAAASYQPDLVLLDIGLPKLNGYEAARRMRQQPAGEDLVIVALTGWGQDEDRRKTTEAGFDGHLVKPVHHATLTKMLADLLPEPA